MTDTFSVLSEKLGALLSEEDQAIFEANFSLLKQDKNLFVFGCRDKAVCGDFLARNRHALLSAAGAVCGRMPELKFRAAEKPTEKTAEKTEKKGARTRAEKAETKPKPKTKRRTKRSKAHVLRNVMASLICLALAFALGVIGVNYVANRTFKENFYSVGITGTYENFRVIQLSDLHDSVYGKDNAALLDRIGKLDPDIIVLTGDCVDQDADIAPAVSLCRALADIAPTYYIYGNNECAKAFSCTMTLEALDAAIGATDDDRDVQKLYALDNGLRAALEETGVKVLFNESDLITIGENRVRIFGTLTSNPSAFWPYAGEAFNRFITENEDEIKLFLCHEPLLLETLDEAYWGDLVLCGDTHGGVLRLPGFGALYTRADGFLPERKGAMVYGKYQHNLSQVIVSSGLENRNPLRLFNQPEMVIADINKY